MKKEYVKPEAEMIKFVESEEIMNLGNDFTESILGIVTDPFVTNP